MDLVDEVGRDVHDLRLHPGRVGDPPGDVVPARSVVTGDVEGLAEHVAAAEEPDEPDGEVVRVCDRPEGRPVAVHDDGLAGPHAVEVRAAAHRGDERAVVGVRRPDDRGREPLLTVGVDEDVLTGDLVPCVLGEWVAERRRLDHREALRRLLVRRGGADEHVLTDASGEPVDVGLHVLRREGRELRDDVELAGAEDLGDGVRVADVRAEEFDLLGERADVGQPAVQDRHVVAERHGSGDGRRGDDAAAADEQDALRRHGVHPRVRGPDSPSLATIRS